MNHACMLVPRYREFDRSAVSNQRANQGKKAQATPKHHRCLMDAESHVEGRSQSVKVAVAEYWAMLNFEMGVHPPWRIELGGKLGPGPPSIAIHLKTLTKSGREDIPEVLCTA